MRRVLLLLVLLGLVIGDLYVFNPRPSAQLISYAKHLDYHWRADAARLVGF